MLQVAPITKVVFFAYFVVLILVSIAAYYKRKKAANFQEEYYVAGRSFGAWLVAFVWATSWTSGGTFIGTPSVYYSFGWCTILWQAGAAVLGICGMLMIGRRISTFASENHCVTLPDLFAERFQSRAMGVIAALSIIVFGVVVMAQPHVITRVFAVRDIKALKRSGALVSIICMIWFFSLFISAQAARALIPAIKVSDQIFPTIVLTYCGKFLAGILMCAPFAAVMSTVSSLTLSCSSAIIKDIYQRNTSKEMSSAALKRVTYVVTLVLAVSVLGFALNPPAFLQDIVMFAVNGFAASFTIPILFGFFWKGSTPMGGLLSMIAGFVTMMSLYLLPMVPTNLLGFNPLIWALVVGGVVMVVVSKCSRKQDAAFLDNLFK